MPGNPSSVHGYGRALRTEIDRARASVAALVGVEPSAVTFTSGATEANALALIGAWRALTRKRQERPFRILTSPIEHASVREALAALATDGAVIDTLPVGAGGVVSAADVAAAITPDTVLVSVMWVNNVLGTVQPVAEIGKVVAAERVRRGAAGLPILFHCDAVQALATLEVMPGEAGIDLMTLSGHKICGPKGAGALIRAFGATIEPIVMGGGQEGGLRHGTENAAGIAGLGRAAGILAEERKDEAVRTAALRTLLGCELASRVPTAKIVGDRTQSSPGIVFLTMSGIPGDRLALALDAAGIAVSAGSACDSGKRRRSHVLSAVLDERHAAHGGVRVSFGRFTEETDMRAFAEALAHIPAH